ncbi:potassium channel LctB [Natronobacillus azotifigens]|uniref:Potassium channel family protein n=1 Tax=Natronobacillus azotifigens TaxID=472978 RepID=A0A9J6RG42_9BACI|nr:potassium channel family protein [Natronobacillus azotifigens]MCZ0704398.1 potassium channel family protein [Natronobacillus azotifigens]
MTQLLLGIATLFIGLNLYYFFMNKTYRKSYFSTALFLKLFFVLCGVLLGFALLYYALSIQEVILVDEANGEPIQHSFWEMLYFSGVTLLSIGYGDIVPIGVARFFSLIQASIGVLLPTAYFLKAFDHSNQKKEKD